MKQRLKRVLRRLGGRRLVAWERRRLQPVLSVVMPVHDAEEYLREALDSVLTQTLHDLELIAVDDGSTDHSLAVLRRYEARDRRVRVLTQPNAGQGAARNAGVAHARGEFLAFVDSDDTVPPDAFATMVAGLRASGSDFSVGAVRRQRGRRFRRGPWYRTVHRVERIGTTLEEFPAAMQDVLACNRMFRTAFWREQVGGFRARTAYEDHVPMLLASVRARRFDVLDKVTYTWRLRDGSTSGKARIQNLRDRVQVLDEAWGLLQGEASQLVRDAWLGRVLEVDLNPFVAQAVDPGLADRDGYRALLEQTYRRYLDLATPRAWTFVRSYSKVRAHLVAQGRWDDVTDAFDWFLGVHEMPPARVVDGALHAILPDASWSGDLPELVTAMSVLESHFEGVVAEATATTGTDGADGTDGTVELTGWMRHRGLDVGDVVPAMSLTLRSGTEEVPLEVVAEPVPEANLWEQLPHAGCAHAGWRVGVPAHVLADDGWTLHGSLTVDGLTSSGEIPLAAQGRPERPPGLADDELGRYHQTRLRQRYAAATAPLTRTILFVTGGGPGSSPGQDAIDGQLAEHHPDVVRLWTGPLPRGSAAWYDALAGSRWICSDADLGPWFGRRPGQTYLRMFGEDLSRPVGAAAWRAAGRTPAEIEHALRDVAREWDQVLAPTPELAARLREQFRWDGAVLTTDRVVEALLAQEDRDQ